MINNEPYIGEPGIFEGDLKKSGGDYKRNYGIDNMILMLVGTEPGYWGNSIIKESQKIPGSKNLLGEPITSTFLKRHSAQQEFALAPLIKNNIATSVKVESFNTGNDRIDWTAKIELIGGNKYFFDSLVGGYYGEV